MDLVVTEYATKYATKYAFFVTYSWPGYLEEEKIAD